MRAPLVLILLVASLLSTLGGEQESYYVDASIEPQGQLLSWTFVDMDQDGALELLMAVRTNDGERELHLHRMRTDRVEPEPYLRVRVFPDVMAWTVADVRQEPGRELVFLTRSAAISYSTTLDGYRGNARVLVREEMIFDLPDPRTLPYYAYVIRRDSAMHGKAGDSLLLPGRDGYSLWGPPDQEGAYTLQADFRSGLVAVIEATAPRSSSRGSRIRLGSDPGDLTGPFSGENASGEAALLSDSRHYRAPALVDVNGDGFVDLLALTDEHLAVHLGTASGLPERPTRLEPLPGYLRGEDQDLELTLVDVDGDGDLDLVAKIEEDSGTFENGIVRVLVLTHDGQRMLPEQPDQVLRFKAADLRLSIADVDADGRPDLVIQKLELPSMLGLVTGLEFTFTHLIYLGQPLGERRRFAKNASLRQEEVYDEETIVELVANRNLTMDCDGDGLADLVEVDLDGRVGIRRLRRSSSFFGGTSWSLERSHWKRFETGGSIRSLDVRDLNGDGLGDVVSAGERRLTILLSVRPGGRR